MSSNTIFDSFLESYSTFKEDTISGRYLNYVKLKPFLNKAEFFKTRNEIGKSFLNVPIENIRLGKGPVKIMGWSQMHGNESTTTKALLDLLNFLVSEDPEAVNILEKCTLLFIPMLNPDGAARYTRENVNGVDLNRDAFERKELESRVLRDCFEDFKPDFCLNLHDQRTIYSAGDDPKTATLSFLAPAMDEDRTINEVRVEAMQVIAAMNEVLQMYLPHQLGRYDDAFNINCTGDTFQQLGVPTILFEAGHFPKDYLREETRKFVALAMFSALRSISERDFERFTVSNYLEIPENRKNFFDIILRNAISEGEPLDIAIQYEEKVKAGEIHFEPVLKTKAPSLSYFGHLEIECNGQEVRSVTGKILNENDIVHDILLNGEKLSIKSQDIP
ncbi:M14 family metallopeptidase [Salinimicrobium flavum]|uniref:M14 metallopeptidase family protein n=1 Tax=Salinimicrobium flavum TaxID=1737065 RepID=A0ABW5IYD3_9FLAO